jgi:hypothetical protein
VANAINSYFNQTESKKKGSTKTVQSVSSDYVESALASELNGNNITLNAGLGGAEGGNLLIQGSKTNAANNTTTNANNTIIQDAVLRKYHYSNKITSSRGIAKMATTLTSTALGAVALGFSAAGAIANPVFKTVDDPLNDAINPLLPDPLSDKLDGRIDAKYARNKTSDSLFDNQFYNTKQKNYSSSGSSSSSGSFLTSGNNFTATSTKDTTIQASKIVANNQLTLNAENLNLLTRSTYNYFSNEDKVSRTMTFKNYNEGGVETKDIINPELISNAGGGAASNNITFNITNKVTAEYNARDWDGVGTAPATSATLSGVRENGIATNSNLAYLNSLKTQIAADKLTLMPIEFTSSFEHDAVRGLTDVGTAVVAIGAVAATVATAGAGAPAMSGGVTIAAGIGTAAASTAAATAAVSATNASMNADGDLFKQIKTTATASYKATTSDESLKNIAIAGATAGLTAGIAEVSGLNDAVRAASAANAAGNSTTIANQIQIAFAESALSTVSSTAAQSAINGDSFNETLKKQGMNILIGAVGNLGAKEIGNAYHSGNISKPLQLTLHGILGCGMGAAANGSGGCASGAVSGITGELTAEVIGDNTSIQGRKLAELSGLAGGLSAIITGNALGLDDGEIADNIFSGQRIAANAAENNYQKDVHKYLTEFLAMAAGYTNDEAKKIGRANYRIDTRWDTQPLTVDTMMWVIGQGHPKADYHFTTPERREELKKLSYMTGNLDVLGVYTHAVEDSFSHQKDGISHTPGLGHFDISTQWFTNIEVQKYIPISRGLVDSTVGNFGEYLDRTYNRPELADEMARKTYQELLDAKFYQTGVRPPDRWNEISEKVKKFNRLVTEDNDKKGRFLFE